MIVKCWFVKCWFTGEEPEWHTATCETVTAVYPVQAGGESVWTCCENRENPYTPSFYRVVWVPARRVSGMWRLALRFAIW